MDSDGMKVLAGLLIVGGLVTTSYFLLRKPPSRPSEPLWEVGDVIWCYCGGDSGYFTITDRRAVSLIYMGDTWEYRIGEGAPPPIEDLGWWMEHQLEESPWLCRLGTMATSQKQVASTLAI